MFSDEVVLCGASAYTKKFYFNEDFEALPQQAKDYVKFLESHIGVPITIVSTGPKRHEIALRQPQ